MCLEFDRGDSHVPYSSPYQWPPSKMTSTLNFYQNLGFMKDSVKFQLHVNNSPVMQLNNLPSILNFLIHIHLLDLKAYIFSFIFFFFNKKHVLTK